MKAIIFSAMMGFALVGCGDASKQVEKYATDACACKDKECAEKVLSSFAGWAKDNKNARGDEKKAAESAQKLAGCVIKAGVEPAKLMDMMKEIAK